MTLTPQALLEACPQLGDCLDSEHLLWVAYSGGCDSHVLLHLVAGLLAERGELKRLRAIHINHNLQDQAGQWAEHCQQVCESLEASLVTETVNAGEIRQASLEKGSLENAARAARYALFSSHVKKGDTLLLAHHADDQMETMLYRLMRGSGPKGLAGMPLSRKLGEGELLRPMLGMARRHILDYARQQRLEWIEDPTNTDPTFDRNFLRNQILPLLEERWPGMQKSWLRSSELLADAETAQTALGRIDRESTVADSSHHLKLAAMTELPEWRQRNLLRYWLAEVCTRKQLPEPDYISLSRIVQEVIPAAESANPLVRWPKREPRVEIRRYQGTLYCLPVLPEVPETLSWDARTPLNLGQGMGVLCLEKVPSQGFPWQGELLEVHFQLPGIKIAIPGRHTRSLSRFCQEQGIPPWVRERLPLICRNHTLLGVADLYLATDQVQESGANLYRVRWDGTDLN